MATRRLRSRASLTAESSKNASARPRRGVAIPAARIERTSPEETRQSIHLTVKAPPSKLRQATSGSSRNIAVSSRERFAGGEIVNGPRGTRNKKVILDETSEEEEDEEDKEPEDDELSDLESQEDDEDIDAEGEEDVEMEDAPPPPPAAKPRGVTRLIKPSINVTRAPDVSSVEAKEMAMANDDDDELSELDSQEEDEEDEGGDEDAEGEDDDMEDVERDDDLDSDLETPLSRSQTPDLSKLTRRQRAIAEETDSGLMFLSNEAQKKKHLTAEEHAMRRAEMARRRKNLSEKRNEEEKMDTINRLLKKQPPKRRGRAAADNGESGQDDEPEVEKASTIYVRYTQTINGSHIAVPEEWLSSPVGTVFAGAVPPSNPPRPFSGRMVEEVA